MGTERRNPQLPHPYTPCASDSRFLQAPSGQSEEMLVIMHAVPTSASIHLLRRRGRNVKSPSAQPVTLCQQAGPPLPHRLLKKSTARSWPQKIPAPVAPKCLKNPLPDLLRIPTEPDSQQWLPGAAPRWTWAQAAWWEDAGSTPNPAGRRPTMMLPMGPLSPSP